jgi:hypothetical protein
MKEAADPAGAGVRSIARITWRVVMPSETLIFDG